MGAIARVPRPAASSLTSPLRPLPAPLSDANPLQRQNTPKSIAACALPASANAIMSIHHGVHHLGFRCTGAGLGVCCAPAACRDMRPTAHSLSFASPKESKQRKGEPNASALRAHCVARAGREARKLAFGSNSARLFFRPTLRYSTPHNGRDSHTRHRFARHSFRQIQAVALIIITLAATD